MSGGAQDRLTSLSASAPFAVAAYCLVLAALRLGFSPFLEVDEAEFVGRVDFRLIYDNAHPPLFNWLTRVALTFTDWSWSDSVALVKYGLLAAFHYLTWDSARRLAGPRAGLLALAASAFLPQIVWMSAVTLAHSIMVLAGVAAVFNASLRLLRKPSLKNGVWLGLAMSLGVLAKFNFFLFLLPFLGALWLEPTARAALWGRAGLLAAGVFAATSLPSLIAAALWREDSGARIEKLYREGKFAAIDPPYVGLDGFLELCVAALAWAGPAVVIWGAAVAWDRRAGEAAPSPRAPSPPISSATPGPTDMVRVLRRSLLGGMALFALVVLAADLSRIEERYLTPVLATLPVYLAAAWPLGRSAVPVAALAGAAYLAVLAGFWGMATYGKHRYAIPYEAVAAQIKRQNPTPAPILTERHDDRANVTLALGWPGARTPRYQPLEGEAVLLWRGRGVAPETLIPGGFGPAAAIITVAAPYKNAREDVAVYSFQRFDRLGLDTPSE